MSLPDCRELLREGDAMLKAGDHVAAIRLYAEAARAFDASGYRALGLFAEAAA